MCSGTERGVADNGQKGYTREEAENDYRAKRQILWIKQLFSYGVPVVLASGNEAETEGRKVIDQFPQVFETDDLPIINVGAATLAGKAAPFSQGLGTQQDPEKRTQLTIYGVGVDVDVHDQYDGAATQDSGTSFAAPAVAGIIATHMNYESWDQSKQGPDRVKEIKRWITTPESSWERAKDPDKQVNMVRTTATQSEVSKEADNPIRSGTAPTKQPTTASPTTSRPAHPLKHQSAPSPSASNKPRPQNAPASSLTPTSPHMRAANSNTRTDTSSTAATTITKNPTACAPLCSTTSTKTTKARRLMRIYSSIRRGRRESGR